MHDYCWLHGRFATSDSVLRVLTKRGKRHRDTSVVYVELVFTALCIPPEKTTNFIVTPICIGPNTQRGTPSSFDTSNSSREDLPACPAGGQCAAFLRLCEKGSFELNDLEHMVDYRHPPRDAAAKKMPRNWNPFVYNENPRVSSAPEEDLSDEKELERLIAEVERNGYGGELTTPEGASLLAIVDAKMGHRRHRRLPRSRRLSRAMMLAVVLYTGCDCNYALCRVMRENDEVTWQWFTWLLEEAIRRLSSNIPSSLYTGETHPRGGMWIFCRNARVCVCVCALHAGLSGVRLDGKPKLLYLAAFTSTSTDERIAGA